MEDIMINLIVLAVAIGYLIVLMAIIQHQMNVPRVLYEWAKEEWEMP